MAAALGAASVKTTSVRLDARSGRLVRTVTVREHVVTPKMVGARPVNPPATPSARLPKPPEQIRKIVDEKARQHGVDPLLVHSVISVESAYNPYAVSPKGAEGLMQLMPGTARTLGVRNSLDPEQNIDGGVRYLKYLQTLFADERLVLAAYNAGEGAVARYGWIPPYAETQHYVYEVGRRYGLARREAARQAPVAATAPPVSAPAADAPKPLIEFVDEQGRIHLTVKE